MAEDAEIPRSHRGTRAAIALVRATILEDAAEEADTALLDSNGFLRDYDPSPRADDVVSSLIRQPKM